MAIAVACSCGKQLHVKDELGGKKIKCPACQTVLAVPGLGDSEAEPAVQVLKPGVPKPALRATIVEDDADDDDLADLPARTKKKKKAMRVKKSYALWWALGGGGLLISLLVCCGGGYGVYYLWWGSSPDKIIVGKWEMDAAASRLANMNNGNADVFAARTIEFTSDGKMIIKMDAISVSGTWKILQQTDSTAKLDTHITIGQFGGGDLGTQLNVTVLSRNQIRIVDSRVGAQSTVWNRK
jgi:hypothetical protein